MRSMHRKSSGFTLIELLVALTIIGVLIALLIPALNAAIVRTREATVTVELNNLSTALASFKSNHGCYPPSRILLCEDGAYLKSGPNFTLTSTQMALVPRSVTYLRSIFPRVQVYTSYVAGSTPWYDFNNNGKLDPPIVIQGTECLPFFLGGMPSQTSQGKWGLSGFAMSPSNPFQNTLTFVNRTRPYYEFDNGRLVDLDNNGFPEYADSFGGSTDPSPIVYFSGYEGAGYDPDDVNTNEPDDSGIYPTTNGAFYVWNDPTASNAANTQGYGSSAGPNPYSETSPVSPQIQWKNKSTFQLITSGRDRKYGAAGNFDSSATNRLPFLDVSQWTGQNLDSGIRIREWDNLSSFTMGRLNP